MGQSVWRTTDLGMMVEKTGAHTGRVESVAFSIDGSRIVSGGDNAIRVWSSKDLSMVLEKKDAHTGTVESVAFSFDGSRIVSGGIDTVIRVWSTADLGTPLLEKFDAHSGRPNIQSGYIGYVRSVAFSIDGTRIISRGEDGKHLVEWSAE